MRINSVIIYFVAIWLIILTHANGRGSLRTCIKALRKLTVNSKCMKCYPTLQSCQGNCQNLVDSTYASCNGICLPDGYYFDSQSVLGGCFDDNVLEIKKSVETCGCNAAFKTNTFSLFYVITLTLIAMLFTCYF